MLLLCSKPFIAPTPIYTKMQGPAWPSPSPFSSDFNFYLLFPHLLRSLHSSHMDLLAAPCILAAGPLHSLLSMTARTFFPLHTCRIHSLTSFTPLLKCHLSMASPSTHITKTTKSCFIVPHRLLLLPDVLYTSLLFYAYLPHLSCKFPIRSGVLSILHIADALKITC